MRFLIILFFSFFSIILLSQSSSQKYKISGKVLDKTSNSPLEFATVTFQNIKNPEIITGGMTDDKGLFLVEVPQGKYNIKVEFISFTPFIIENKEINTAQSLGNISLTADAQMLNEVVVTSERTTVEMKLDKKVYNLGQDLMVKGGTASDVLDNVPSVSVDAEGNVLLRGNENVRILIDGRISNALNI